MKVQIRGSSGFTLIEIMVVMVVLGALAALVGPNILRHIGRSKVTTARTQVEMIGAALDSYRLDNDVYPTTEQGLAALRAAPGSEPRPRAWNGPYLRKDVPNDPWGRPYRYRSGTGDPDREYELISFGRDGREGGEGDDADVVSWK